MRRKKIAVETVVPAPGEAEFVWRATVYKDKAISIDAGLDFQDYPEGADPQAMARVIGEMMVKIGTRLIGADLESHEQGGDDGD